MVGKCGARSWEQPDLGSTVFNVEQFAGDHFRRFYGGTSIPIAHVHLPVIIRLKSLVTRCVAMASLLQAYCERG